MAEQEVKSPDETMEEAVETAEETMEAQVEETADSEEANDAEASEAKEGKGIFKKKEKKDKRDEQIAELNDKVLRQMAEFENFRKRTEKEKAMMFEIGAKSIVEKLRPVIRAASECTMGVYLLHFYVSDRITPWLRKTFPLPGTAEPMLLRAVAVFLVTMALVRLLRKLPFVGRTFL